MPLVTLTVRKPKSAEFKAAVLDAVHAALVSAGVPAADLFQRVLELAEADFRFDPAYPDLQSSRNADFVLIEILWSVGRSVKVKKKMLAELMGELGVRRRPPHPHLIGAQEARFSMRTLMRVPRPGSLSICHSPPMAPARWRMLARPNP